MISDLKINEERKRFYYEQGYWTDQTLNDIWTTQVAAYAESEYVVDDQGKRLTYSEIDDQASRLAHWLADQGIVSGDIVSFQIPVWSEFVITTVACFKLGAVIHPLSMRFNSEDLVTCLAQVDSKFFLCPARFHDKCFENQLASIIERVPDIIGVMVIEHGMPHTTPYPTFEHVIADTAPLEDDKGAKSADEVVLILSTSGSTGKPKAVLLTHNNIVFSERAFTSELELDERDIMFMPAPLNHATGFIHGLISPLLLGGKTVLQQDFCAPEAIDFMNAEGVTWSMGATPFIYDMLKSIECTGVRPETLRFYLCGGAPLPGAMIRRARQAGVVLCEVYGSTESCPHVYVPPAYALGWNGKYSGRAFKGIEIAVVDEQGKEVAPGVQGEEISRGPNVFVGYYQNKEATDRVLTDEGWFYSGDLAVKDERGRIRIVGRKKDIIIRGGINISSAEVDEVVLGCPRILDHATVGMPDERLGERICLYVVPEKGYTPKLEDITGYLKEKRVAKRIWPEHIEIIDAIPYTESGKTKRTILAQDLKTRLGVDE